MKKPRVLVGLTYYLPNISGVTQYAVILAETLTKRNYDVLILTAGYKKCLKHETGVKRIWGVGLGKGFIMPLYWWESFWAVKNADVINCHLPSIESFWLALWGKILDKRVIVTHHCEFDLSGNLGNKIIGFLSFPIHWWAYWWADTIVAYTADYANNSIFLKNFSKKVVCILPPIKVEETKVKLDLGKEKIVGFVGRVAWEKGLDVLIEAMKNVKAKLILVGPYENVVGDKTYEKIKDVVEFFGPIKHKDLKAFYEQCDCLVLPSINSLETFGIVQAEAMVCGCPVVASNLPGVRVPVQMSGMGEICAVGDAKDLENKIRLILKNGKKYYQRRAKNLELFDYQRTVDEYEKIFFTTEKL